MKYASKQQLFAAGWKDHWSPEEGYVLHHALAGEEYHSLAEALAILNERGVNEKGLMRGEA